MGRGGAAVVLENAQQRVFADDVVGRLAVDDAAGRVLDQVVIQAVERVGAVGVDRSAAGVVEVSGDDRVMKADGPAGDADAAAGAGDIAVGIGRVAGDGHVVEFGRAAAADHQPAAGSQRAVAADRAVDERQPAIAGHAAATAGVGEGRVAV